MRVFMGYSATPPETLSDEQSETKQGLFVDLARECARTTKTEFQPDRPVCIRILVLRYKEKASA